MANTTSDESDPLVGTWFQSYDYISPADRPEGGEEYLDCIAAASSPTDLQDCAELIPQ